MAWQRATEIVKGRTYSWYGDGTDPWEAMTDPVVSGGRWGAVGRFLSSEIPTFAGSSLSYLPFEQAPVAPWIVRTEYRAPRSGDYYLADDGTPLLRFVGSESAAVCLIIEPNPDYQAGA